MPHLTPHLIINFKDNQEAEAFAEALEEFVTRNKPSELLDHVFEKWCAKNELPDSMLVKSTAFSIHALRSVLRHTQGILEAEHKIAQKALEDYHGK